VAGTIYRKVIRAADGRTLVERARWCDGFASKLRGFTFRRSLSPGEGLVLVEPADGRMTSAVTMLFCFMDLGVIWVNDAGEVVDKTVARPWRLSYVAQAPARYVVESDPVLLAEVEVGQRLEFVPGEPGQD
jgi:uncharacterized membrane protein (UPF0127 family)